MNGFNGEEAAACQRLIDLALTEDLGTAGDLTSQAILPPDLQGRAVFVARTEGVVAGLPAAALVCAAVEASATFQATAHDGSPVQHGDRLATVSGPMRAIVATTALESTPPLRNAPSGTSAIRRSRTDSSSRSRSLSTKYCSGFP